MPTSTNSTEEIFQFISGVAEAENKFFSNFNNDDDFASYLLYMIANPESLPDGNVLDIILFLTKHWSKLRCFTSEAKLLMMECIVNYVTAIYNDYETGNEDDFDVDEVVTTVRRAFKELMDKVAADKHVFPDLHQYLVDLVRTIPESLLPHAAECIGNMFRHVEYEVKQRNGVHMPRFVKLQPDDPLDHQQEASSVPTNKEFDEVVSIAEQRGALIADFFVSFAPPIVSTLDRVFKRLPHDQKVKLSQELHNSIIWRPYCMHYTPQLNSLLRQIMEFLRKEYVPLLLSEDFHVDDGFKNCSFAFKQYRMYSEMVDMTVEQWDDYFANSFKSELDVAYVSLALSTYVLHLAYLEQLETEGEIELTNKYRQVVLKHFEQAVSCAALVLESNPLLMTFLQGPRIFEFSFRWFGPVVLKPSKLINTWRQRIQQYYSSFVECVFQSLEVLKRSLDMFVNACYVSAQLSDAILDFLTDWTHVLPEGMWTQLSKTLVLTSDRFTKWYKLTKTSYSRTALASIICELIERPEYLPDMVPTLYKDLHNSTTFPRRLMILTTLMDNAPNQMANMLFSKSTHEMPALITSLLEHQSSKELALFIASYLRVCSCRQGVALNAPALSQQQLVLTKIQQLAASDINVIAPILRVIPTDFLDSFTERILESRKSPNVPIASLKALIVNYPRKEYLEAASKCLHELVLHRSMQERQDNKAVMILVKYQLDTHPEYFKQKFTEELPIIRKGHASLKLEKLVNLQSKSFSRKLKKLLDSTFLTNLIYLLVLHRHVDQPMTAMLLSRLKKMIAASDWQMLLTCSLPNRESEYAGIIPYAKLIRLLQLMQKNALTDLVILCTK